jgi:sialidase-1
MRLSDHGAQEPSIVRLKSGSLLAVLRTSLGTIYKSHSHDEGNAWTKPVSTGLAAPASTPLLKRLPGSDDLLLVWNNTYDPKHPDFQNGYGPRNPLTSAISTDEGETWKNVKTIEDRSPGASSTPAVTFVGDEALLTYNTQPYKLSKRELYSIRLKIMSIDWFRSE